MVSYSSGEGIPFHLYDLRVDGSFYGTNDYIEVVFQRRTGFRFYHAGFTNEEEVKESLGEMHSSLIELSISVSRDKLQEFSDDVQQFHEYLRTAALIPNNKKRIESFRSAHAWVAQRAQLLPPNNDAWRTYIESDPTTHWQKYTQLGPLERNLCIADPTLLVYKR